MEAWKPLHHVKVLSHSDRQTFVRCLGAPAPLAVAWGTIKVILALAAFSVCA